MPRWAPRIPHDKLIRDAILVGTGEDDAREHSIARRVDGEIHLDPSRGSVVRESDDAPAAHVTISMPA